MNTNLTGQTSVFASQTQKKIPKDRKKKCRTIYANSSQSWTRSWLFPAVGYGTSVSPSPCFFLLKAEHMSTRTFQFGCQWKTRNKNGGFFHTKKAEALHLAPIKLEGLQVYRCVFFFYLSHCESFSTLNFHPFSSFEAEAKSSFLFWDCNSWIFLCV